MVISVAKKKILGCLLINSFLGALAKILQDATEASASAFKARGIPEALRVVELLGIEQSRKWGACTVCPSIFPFSNRSLQSYFERLVE